MTDVAEGARWRRVVPARPIEVVIVLAAVVLVVATAFGLWHVIVGGLISGNPRAAAFGAGLALVAGMTLVAGAVVVAGLRRVGFGRRADR